MASNLEFRGADGASPITSVPLGTIPVGSSYQAVSGAYRKIVIFNTGDATATDVKLYIRQRLTAGFESGTLYPDNGGTPNTGSPQTATSGAFALSDIAASASVTVWLDASVPSGSTNGSRDLTIQLLYS